MAENSATVVNIRIYLQLKTEDFTQLQTLHKKSVSLNSISLHDYYSCMFAVSMHVYSITYFYFSHSSLLVEETVDTKYIYTYVTYWYVWQIVLALNRLGVKMSKNTDYCICVGKWCKFCTYGNIDTKRHLRKYNCLKLFILMH